MTTPPMRCCIRLYAISIRYYLAATPPTLLPPHLPTFLPSHLPTLSPSHGPFHVWQVRHLSDTIESLDLRDAVRACTASAVEDMVMQCTHLKELLVLEYEVGGVHVKRLGTSSSDPAPLDYLLPDDQGLTCEDRIAKVLVSRGGVLRSGMEKDGGHVMVGDATKVPMKMKTALAGDGDEEEDGYSEDGLHHGDGYSAEDLGYSDEYPSDELDGLDDDSDSDDGPVPNMFMYQPN